MKEVGCAEVDETAGDILKCATSVSIQVLGDRGF